MKKINVLVVEPNRVTYPKNIESTMEAFIHEVGGDIEMVRITDEVVLIINKQMDGLFNRELMKVSLYGTFLLGKVFLGENKISSLNEVEMKRLKKVFKENNIQEKDVLSFARIG